MSEAQAQTVTAQPNIVFILTDDIRKDDMMYMPKSHSLLSVLGDERPKPRDAEHLAFWVVSLYKTVAVEQDALASIEHYLLLLIATCRHEPQWHPPGP